MYRLSTFVLASILFLTVEVSAVYGDRTSSYEDQSSSLIANRGRSGYYSPYQRYGNNFGNYGRNYSSFGYNRNLNSPYYYYSPYYSGYYSPYYYYTPYYYNYRNPTPYGGYNYNTYAWPGFSLQFGW